MKSIKTHIGEMLFNKKVHFYCNCIMNIDVTGIVKGWKVVSNEVIWEVELSNGKMIKIGENHPNMSMEIL